jgi:hypothetical protein
VEHAFDIDVDIEQTFVTRSGYRTANVCAMTVVRIAGSRGSAADAK